MRRRGSLQPRPETCCTRVPQSVHTIIPKRAERPRSRALTCDSRTLRYPHFQIGAFGSAECVDRQDRVGLDAVAATSDASRGGFDHGSGLRVAASGTWRAGASSPVMILGTLEHVLDWLTGVAF